MLDTEGENYYSKFPETIDYKVDTKNFNGKKIFKVTHEQLVQEWQDSDYELTFCNGLCEKCVNFWVGFHKPCEVITQKGVLRNNIAVGFCLPCINSSLGNNYDISLLTMKVPFEQSDDIHELTITIDKLFRLSQRNWSESGGFGAVAKLRRPLPR